MNQKNYLPLVSALEDLRDFAMNFKVRTEDGEGRKKNFQITGLRFCFLGYSRRSFFWNNGFSLEKPSDLQETQLSMVLFYGNQKKVISHPETFVNLSQDPCCLKATLRPLLRSSIESLISEFYASSIRNNRDYQEDQSNPVILEDQEFQLPEFSAELSSECSQKILDLSKNSYLSPAIISSASTFTFSRKWWIVVDSWGTRVIDHQDSYSFYHYCKLYDAKKKIVVPDSFVRVFTSLQQLDPILDEASLAVQTWINALGSRSLKSGIYPLVFSPSAVGTLFHEALAAHMLSGLYIYQGISTVFAKKIGKQIASDDFMSCLKELQIWDCSNDPEMSAHYRYDMEGVRSQDVCLIDHGVVKNYLLDRNSAKALNMQNNGHALAGSFLDVLTQPTICEPRISNLKVLSDSKLSLDQLQKNFIEEFGYYLWVDSYAGEVNVETGTFELKVDRLFKVDANGKKTWYTGGTFSSNLTDFLSAICLISNHYGHTQGFCGALSGSVPTEEYAPVMGLYGVNWIPEAVEVDDPITYDPKKEKYIPESWEEKVSSFEI